MATQPTPPSPPSPPGRRPASPFRGAAASVVVMTLGSLLLGSLLLGCTPAAEATLVTVYKTPTCGCCSKWIDHLEDAGFEVESKDLPDLTTLKAANGVPGAMASCHTAMVGGYVIEGHVPAADIRRLLEERPAVAGLAVPGMPLGSPGMEHPDPRRHEAYDVFAFGATNAAGGLSRFAHHTP